MPRMHTPTAVTRTLTLAATTATVALPTLDAHAQDAVQWRVEDGGNGHWYQWTGCCHPYEESKAAAASVGGHIMTFGSMEEERFVEDTFASGWLALEMNGDGDYEWTTGEPLEYTNWAEGQPYDEGSNYILVVSDKGTSDAWTTAPLNGGSSLIIEWSADCNEDGIVDYGQILDGILADDDGNGVPDDCEQPGGIDGILDVPTEYATVQDAADASNPGSTIRIDPGTYFEEVVLPAHDLQIVARHPGTVTMNGENTRSHLRAPDLEGGTLQVHGINFRNGRKTPTGASIFIAAGSLVIDSCLFEDNGGFNSSHIVYAEDGDHVVARDCDFRSNGYQPCDGCGTHPGLSIINYDSALVERCSFLYNSHARASLLIYRVSDAVVRGCRFIGNESHDDGAGITVREQTNCLIQGCYFESNYGTPQHVRGDIDVHWNDAHAVIRDCQFHDWYRGPITRTGSSTSARVSDSLFCKDGLPLSDGIEDGGGNIFLEHCEEPDCNGDDIDDIEQIFDGSLSDCDANLVPDDCDLNDITSLSESRSPTAGGGDIEFDLSTMSAADDTVTLEVTAVGDLGAGKEFMFVYLDEALLGLAFASSGKSCAAVTDTFDIPADIWNAAGDDGSRTIRLAGVNIEPDTCSEPMTAIRVVVPIAFEDCDGSGTWDACDIASGDAADIDGNGVPDSCDPDCDGDGEPDGYEIATGQDIDCNGNLVPDACDIAEGGDSNDVDSDGVPDDCQPDCDEDGLPDAWELAEGLAMDCNDNGHPDNCDIAEGTSNDVDSNGVPDECKNDCNGNGLPDYWEILQATVEDCNDNLVPDECDISAGIMDDCDLDGRGDECTVADGSVEDCNGNGIPDFCDLEDGTADDDNQNGIPDICEVLAGDLNLDGCIDSADLGLLIALWGVPDPPIGDLDGNQQIDAADLGALLGAWTPCP